MSKKHIQLTLMTKMADPQKGQPSSLSDNDERSTMSRYMKDNWSYSVKVTLTSSCLCLASRHLPPELPYDWVRKSHHIDIYIQSDNSWCLPTGYMGCSKNYYSIHTNNVLTYCYMSYIKESHPFSLDWEQ